MSWPEIRAELLEYSAAFPDPPKLSSFWIEGFPSLCRVSVRVTRVPEDDSPIQNSHYG